MGDIVRPTFRSYINACNILSWVRRGIALDRSYQLGWNSNLRYDARRIFPEKKTLNLLPNRIGNLLMAQRKWYQYWCLRELESARARIYCNSPFGKSLISAIHIGDLRFSDSSPLDGGGGNERHRLLLPSRVKLHLAGHIPRVIAEKCLPKSFTFRRQRNCGWWLCGCLRRRWFMGYGWCRDRICAQLWVCVSILCLCQRVNAGNCPRMRSLGQVKLGYTGCRL